jgi:hypothetical protein
MPIRTIGGGSENSEVFVGRQILVAQSSSVSLNIPSNVEDGDLMIVSYGIRNASSPSLSGWTELLNRDFISGEYGAIWCKIADGDSSLTVNAGSTNTSLTTLSVFRGFSGDIETQTPSGSIAGRAIASLSGSKDNLLYLISCTFYNSGIVFDFGNGNSAVFISYIKTNTGTYDVGIGNGYKVLKEDGETGVMSPRFIGSTTCHWAAGFIFEKT